MKSTSDGASKVASKPPNLNQLSTLIQWSLEQGLGIWDYGEIEPFDPKRHGYWNHALDEAWYKFPFMSLKETREYQEFHRDHLQKHTIELDVSSRRACKTGQSVPVVMMLVRKDPDREVTWDDRRWKIAYAKMRCFLNDFGGFDIGLHLMPGKVYDAMREQARAQRVIWEELPPTID